MYRDIRNVRDGTTDYRGYVNIPLSDVIQADDIMQPSYVST
jgi:hypothetical protein